VIGQELFFGCQAQLHWEDHERQAVGAVLDGIKGGGISEVKQLKAWEKDLSPKAYADLSEMLAARAPVVAKNDPMKKEQAIAAIESLKLKADGDTDPRLVVQKMDLDLSHHFSGSTLAELQGRLAARVQSPDAGRESILGGALKKLGEWAFGPHVNVMNPKGALAEGELGSTVPAAETGTPSPSLVERVKAIREDLQEAIKTGKLQNKEDARDFVAQRVIAANVELPGVEATGVKVGAGPNTKFGPLGAQPSPGAPIKAEGEGAVELRPEQGIWMSPSLREQAAKMAGDAPDKLTKISAPTNAQPGSTGATTAAISRPEFQKLNAEQRASSEEFTSATKKAYLWHMGESFAGLSEHKSPKEFATPLVTTRWKDFQADMEARLEVGDKMGAAQAIRQLYSDIAENGAAVGQPTAGSFMRKWLENQPAGSDGQLRTISLSEDDMKSVLDTQNTQQKLARSFLDSPAWNGAKDLSVKDLTLPKITIGDSNPNMYHTLGEFTVRFSGEIHVETKKTGVSEIHTVTFDGTFDFDDKYDWAESKGKNINLGGMTIPDTWAELVEKQGLAKGFLVDGKIKTKLTGSTEVAGTTSSKDKR
jgi:hypothetical protein